MSSHVELRDALVAAWRTNDRVTTFLVENLPAELWPQKVPGAPRRTIRMIAGHLHNARCMWVKWLGREHGLTVPRSVDRHRVKPPVLVKALKRSGLAVSALIERGLNSGGTLPAAIPYRNVPSDVAHFVAYLVAHEAHHRGQICMVARQLGHRLPAAVTAGIWQWSRRAAEASP